MWEIFFKFFWPFQKNWTLKKCFEIISLQFRNKNIVFKLHSFAKNNFDFDLWESSSPFSEQNLGFLLILHQRGVEVVRNGAI